MKRLYLIRHSRTQANEKHLYCGWTDLPLTENGRRIAADLRGKRALPEDIRFASSGMLRASETLLLLYGKASEEILPEMKEMNFGEFEMHSYEQLLSRPEYIRWIEDETGDLPCPGGESRNGFNRRVLQCANKQAARRDIDNLLILCHGGVIANIMEAWFPEENRNFYEWQPGACGGYMINIENGKPTDFEDIE